MNRTADEIGRSVDAYEAQIGDLKIERVVPLRRERIKLTNIIRRYAQETQDVELINWLQNEETQFDEDTINTAEQQQRLEASEMKRQPAETYEEALARLEHTEALAKLATHRLDLHIDFLSKANTRLKEKIAELGLPLPGDSE
jgi:hypothetical protein